VSIKVKVVTSEGAVNIGLLDGDDGVNFSVSGDLAMPVLAAHALKFMQSYVDEARRQLVELRLVSEPEAEPRPACSLCSDNGRKCCGDFGTCHCPKGVALAKAQDEAAERARKEWEQEHGQDGRAASEARKTMTGLMDGYMLRSASRTGAERRAFVEEVAVSSVALAIADLMQRSGISRRDVAERAGVTEAQISLILSADGNPKVKTLARLADVLGCDMRMTFVAVEDDEDER
jgi:DNA-binding phage protein